jgi:hypothetical protein
VAARRGSGSDVAFVFGVSQELHVEVTFRGPARPGDMPQAGGCQETHFEPQPSSPQWWINGRGLRLLSYGGNEADRDGRCAPKAGITVSIPTCREVVVRYVESCSHDPVPESTSYFGARRCLHSLHSVDLLNRRKIPTADLGRSTIEHPIGNSLVSAMWGITAISGMPISAERHLRGP